MDWLEDQYTGRAADQWHLVAGRASTARLRRAKAVFSCTPGLAAWRPIAVTKALIPPCVCVCVCVCVCDCKGTYIRMC